MNNYSYIDLINHRRKNIWKIERKKYTPITIVRSAAVATITTTTMSIPITIVRSAAVATITTMAMSTPITIAMNAAAVITTMTTITTTRSTPTRYEKCRQG